MLIASKARFYFHSPGQSSPPSVRYPRWIRADLLQSFRTLTYYLPYNHTFRGSLPLVPQSKAEAIGLGRPLDPRARNL